MDEGFTEIEFGSQTVAVPKGGYYDRFRMNPDLDAVAQDAAVDDVSWFRRIPKQRVESRVGSIWAPNFYYRARSIQLLMTAPVARLRAMLPEPLEPLRAFPGRGLVALTFFAYDVCDNDPYREVSIAAVVRRPGARGPHSFELLDSMRRRSFFAHVLALPVDTEIARVRGVHGYQLPKWRTTIDIATDDAVQAEIQTTNGSPDLSMSAPVPTFTEAASQSHMGTSTMLHQVDGRWHQTVVRSNTLSYAQRSFPHDVHLERHGGPISQLLDGLGAAKILRMDVVRNAQTVLNLPAPLRTSDR
ncbi:acetoacetate decarboxylase family protein [Salinisphaera sp. T31B1]|uniref:acetoacetate decarboxylase family protein n=1 Tax=Salinisphaera sp. T31B1 TaxID=727963 RepID=UPI00333F70AE